MSSPPRLLFRADADPRMGTGHLMRCLALAQAWLDLGGEATLLTACALPELNARTIAEGVRVEPLAVPAGSDADAERTRTITAELGAEWIVLDGYHFSPEFQRRVRGESLRLAV